jgi:SAM-dependent methyltransferase
VLTVEFSRLRLRPGALVLDLGCGDGRHARAARLFSRVSVVAVDVGGDEIAAAARSLRQMDDQASPFPAARDGGAWLALRADSYRLPFDDEAFDCVVASEVLEHLRDDDRALAEIHRVLKPGGELVVSVPRFGPEAICWALSSEYRNSPGGHVRIYRRSALTRKIAAHGFELFDAHFAHALHTPYWWLKCAVGLQKTGGLVGLYHRFLVWEMFARPRLTRSLEWLLNPVIGKSEVFYARKPGVVLQLARVPRRGSDKTAAGYAAACS